MGVVDHACSTRFEWVIWMLFKLKHVCFRCSFNNWPMWHVTCNKLDSNSILMAVTFPIVYPMLSSCWSIFERSDLVNWTQNCNRQPSRAVVVRRLRDHLIVNSERCTVWYSLVQSGPPSASLMLLLSQSLQWRTMLKLYPLVFVGGQQFSASRHHDLVWRLPAG